MALFERIARRKDNGQPMTDEDMALHIPRIKFQDALWQIIGGAGVQFETSAQVKTKLGIRTAVDASGRSDEQDWDALAAAAPPNNQPGQQAFYMSRVCAVLGLMQYGLGRAAKQYPGLTTPNQARTRLGVPTAPGSL